jgi:hypothetical protein
VFILFLLETAVELYWDHRFYSDSVLTVQRIVFAVAILVHVVGADVASNLGILVHAF